MAGHEMNHRELIKELVEALEGAKAHCDELREAWERGSLRSHDLSGGTRSNRNVDVLVSLRVVLGKAKAIQDCIAVEDAYEAAMDHGH